jgi:hypothetical protein
MMKSLYLPLIATSPAWNILSSSYQGAGPTLLSSKSTLDWSLEQMMGTLGELPHFYFTLSFHLQFQFSSHFCKQLL